ncbi:hypothetical protein ES708_04096 [subsurface metagenome]
MNREEHSELLLKQKLWLMSDFCLCQKRTQTSSLRMDVKEGIGMSRGLSWHSSVEASDVLLPDFERMKQMNMLEQHLLKLPARMKELQNLE